MSFAKLATLTVSTKRPPAMSGGKRGKPVEYLTGVSCTPLDPVMPEVRASLHIETPHELLECFIDEGVDVKEGDYIVYGGKDYPVRSAAEWVWQESSFVHLILEDIK